MRSNCASSGNQRGAITSSSKGARTLVRPCWATRAAMVASAPGCASVGCQVQCGRPDANQARCWPVPEAISNALPRSGSTWRSTSRMGCLLRSAAGLKSGWGMAKESMQGFRSRLLIKRFDPALQLDQQRIALAIQRLACGHLNPALADAVFRDIQTLLVMQSNANVMFEHGSDVKGTALVNG